MYPRARRMTQEEIAANNLEYYEKLARDRALHLCCLYIMISGILIGSVITFYFR